MTDDAKAVGAVAAIVAQLAESYGVRVTPTLLSDRSNLVFDLGELPVVARVAMATSAARVGIAWLQREVEISTFLGAAFTTVPSTLIPPGPFDVGGVIVSFWQRESLLSVSVEPRSVGVSLARVHEKLREYPSRCLPLWGAWQEAHQVRERVAKHTPFSVHEQQQIDRAFLRGDAIVKTAASRSVSMQAVHGDAHLGNVLHVQREATGHALWTDWEDAFVGPVEYDLACLLSKAELFGEDRDAIHTALGAYGARYNSALLSDLALVRNAQVIVWLALFAERQPELLERMRMRISKLP